MRRIAVTIALAFGVVSCAGDCGSPTGGDADGGPVDVEYADVPDAGACDGYVDRNPAACRERPNCVVGCGECVPAPDVGDALGCPTDAGDTGAADADSGDEVDGSQLDTGDTRGDGSDARSDASDTDAGVPTWRTCTESSDCTLVKDGCCGWCGTPTLGDLDPVHRNRTQQHFNDVCANPGMPCPGCPQSPIPDSFEAHCAGGVCMEIDLSPYQNCSSDSDCRVRTLDCCEDCTSDTDRDALVAINTGEASAVERALCPSANPVCAKCPIQYPSGVSAVCNADGRCELK